MKEENFVYIDVEIIAILRLYVEGYMTEKQKGFKNLLEEKHSLQRLKNSMQEVIDDCSEYLGISKQKVLEIINECLEEEKKNPEARKKYKEEYDILAQILQNLDIGIIKEPGEK